jgi:hypothetical protein
MKKRMRFTCLSRIIQTIQFHADLPDLAGDSQKPQIEQSMDEDVHWELPEWQQSAEHRGRGPGYRAGRGRVPRTKQESCRSKTT